MISSIILAVALIFAVAAVHKLGGDARHYRTMWENEKVMNKALWDKYRALENRSSRKQSGLDAEVYAKAMQSNPIMEELDAVMSSCRQNGEQLKQEGENK